MLPLMFFQARYRLGFFLLLFCMTAWAFVGVPELSLRVTDLTGTLSVEQVTHLENKLAAFESKTGSQIAVLIVPTTGPKDIAGFGIEVADLWKIGRKGVDDGVILLVAKDDRKLRLEVGYGLEGVIPDAIAKRVIAETITPYFKNGDYAGGIDAGVEQLMKLIEGEELLAPSENTDSPQDEGGVMMVLVVGLIVGFVLSAMMGQVMGGMLSGVLSGLVATLFMGLTFSLAMFVGIMVFFIVSVRSTDKRGLFNSGGFRGGGGGSWSGGGGGFGGGGASGSW
ncbi:MAG: YgcG family protein [Methylobacter sp.]|nr:YgcG family protein [Methylobacter sp.]